MFKTINDAVEKHSKMILDSERHIWNNPETGFKEVKTNKYLADLFTEMGYKLVMAGDIPGFYTDFDTGREGPCVLVMGEMDALICADHPECDKETKAVHVCGHNAQCAALLGVAAALREKGVADGLCGKIRLCAVPAEELIEIGFRNELIKQGVIKYYGGKPEFLRRGYFDGVDMSMMIHTSTANGFTFTECAVGCVAKSITYKGVSAHAGGFPNRGVNALYEANLGLAAVNSLRETFLEKDFIRFHPIITKGGNAVNAIPDEVIIESYVRGKTIDAIELENKKINRALIGAALSVGGNVDISDKMGYFPFTNDKNFLKTAISAVSELPYKIVREKGTKTGSTDNGDLSAIMPAIQAYAGGAKGNGHGSNYYIVNPQNACVDSAKAQLLILRALLSDNAASAKLIISRAKPPFKSKEEYFKRIDAITRSGDRIKYEGSEAKVSL